MTPKDSINIHVSKGLLKSIPWKFVALGILVLIGSGSGSAVSDKLLEVYGIKNATAPALEKAASSVVNDLAVVNSEVQTLKDGMSDVIIELKEMNRTLGRLEGRMDIVWAPGDRPPVGGIP